MAWFTSQQRWVVEPKHLEMEWGLGMTSDPGKGLLCGICREQFKVGQGVRWVSASFIQCCNFFVCDMCDTPDVKDRWKQITMLAQKEPYDLAAEYAACSAEMERCHALMDFLTGEREEGTVSIETLEFRLRAYIADDMVNGDD